MNAAAMSAFRMTADAGYVIGPLALGLIADLYGPVTALLIASALIVMVGAMFGVVAPESSSVFAILSAFLIVIHLGFASATALTAALLPILISVLQTLPGDIHKVGMTMLLGFTVTQYAFRSIEPLYGAQPGEQQLRSLAVDGAGAAVWEWTARRDEVKVSPIVEAILGLKPGELSARIDVFGRHMHPADRAYHAIRDRWPRDHDFESDPAAHAEFRAAFDAHSVLEERLADHHCARLAAIKRLMRIPAPDLPALGLKIELAVDHQVHELTGGERCMAILKTDVRRLIRTDQI